MFILFDSYRIILFILASHICTYVQGEPKKIHWERCAIMCKAWRSYFLLVKGTAFLFLIGWREAKA